MNVAIHVVDLIYAFAMQIARIGLPLVARFNAKLLRRVDGERELRERIHPRSVDDPKHSVWMHAASMGELEQLVPVMERLRASVTDVRITVTCTSPSGVEHAQRLGSLIDAVAYLAVDTKANAEAWIRKLLPDLIVFDRYDLWRNHIRAAHFRGIPICLINATSPSTSMPVVRAWLADTYRRCAWISAVTEQDALELRELIRGSVDVAPDTRVDRVVDRVRAIKKPMKGLAPSDQPTLVVGSSWPEDETIIISAIKRSAWKGRCIVVPHEPTESALRAVEKVLPCTRWSVAGPETTGHLLVDSVGELLSIYALADAAWVGGGFGAGVHSLAEPAAYGIPLACGPSTHRARDANPLVQLRALTVCSSINDAAEWLANVVSSRSQARERGIAAEAYIHDRTGAADRHAQRIEAYLQACTIHTQPDP